MYTVEI